MTYEEAKQLADSLYAIAERNTAIKWFDLYTNNHAILQKPNKVVGDKVFRTAKLPVNFYELVVKFIVNFVLAQPVTVHHSDEDFQQFIRKFHQQNNINLHNAKLLEHMCVFGKAFEHIYFDKDGNLRIRLIDGLAAIPFWDDYMELEMFVEDYRVKDELLGETRYLRVFTEEATYEFIENHRGVLSEEVTENLFGMPIIAYKNNEFHRLLKSDFEIIQPLVEEYERVLSAAGDIIHYHADPILVAFGQKLPDIGGTGKILNFEKGADVKYLTWDQNIEALNWYVSQLKNLIYELSMTPKFVFEQQAVSNLSGVALKLLYSAALVKANEKQQALQEMKKRYKYLAKIYEVQTAKRIEDDVDIDFAVTIPTNEVELINSMLSLYSAGLVSKETVLQKVPYIEDVQKELQKLAKEEAAIEEEELIEKRIDEEISNEETG